MVTRIYKIGSEIRGSALIKCGGPKTAKIGPIFGQLRNLIANISGKEQDIIEWKTVLQTAISSAHAYLIW